MINITDAILVAQIEMIEEIDNLVKEKQENTIDASNFQKFLKNKKNELLRQLILQLNQQDQQVLMNIIELKLREK